MDASWNLAALCRQDHRANHDGDMPTVYDLLAIAAMRHGCIQDDILGAIYWIRRLPKGLSPENLETAKGKLVPVVRRLVEMVL